MTLNTNLQMAAILQTSLPQITIKVMSIQQQENRTDCGVFAIASALELCVGNDPTKVSWHADQLHPHLKTYLSQQEISPFPQKSTPREHGSADKCYKTVETKVYCCCRMPERRSEKMAKCCGCGEWFHQNCKNIPNTVITRKLTWTCNSCA